MLGYAAILSSWPCIASFGGFARWVSPFGEMQQKNSRTPLDESNVEHFHNGQGQWSMVPVGAGEVDIFFIGIDCFPLKFRGCPVHQFTGGSQA